uniref:C2H2-type domain-containing protein n=1 Tax=viral metagenome TaxID=1070528 RepID=A0A6C0IHX4_9ZZZZ
MDTKKLTDFTDILTCKYCNTVCSRKSEMSRHILTRKHTSRVNGSNLDIKNVTENKQHICCKCDKVYLTNGGLWKHLKKCKYEQSENIIIEKSSEDVTVLTSLVMELIKSNSDLQKQLVDVCKNNNNTINSNNNYNSNNKTFNLQFFLNEQCKDAMNISDFANSINLQLSDFESVGELGYVEGITKIMLDRLNSMDIYKRPIHCSDAKREIIYVKDDDKWEKEEANNPKLRYAIKTISFNNMKLMGLWSSTYPESMDGESHLNDKYMKLIKQSTGGNGEIGDSENKIIRRIVKDILIDKK